VGGSGTVTFIDKGSRRPVFADISEERAIKQFKTSRELGDDVEEFPHPLAWAETDARVFMDIHGTFYTVEL